MTNLGPDVTKRGEINQFPRNRVMGLLSVDFLMAPNLTSPLVESLELEDVPAKPEVDTMAKAESSRKELQRVIKTAAPVRPSPESFVKHMDVVEDSPASSLYRHVSRTLFKEGKENSAQNKAAIEDGTDTDIANVIDALSVKAHQSPYGDDHNDDHPSADEIKTPIAEANPVTKDSAEVDSTHKESANDQQTKNDEANALTLQSVARAHRDDILEHQAECNKVVQHKQQDCEDRIAYWQRKSEVNNEELTADLAKAQDRVEQVEQGWKEEREITKIELVETRYKRDGLQEQVEILQAKLEGREKLEGEVQTLKTERSKYVNRILHLDKELSRRGRIRRS